MTHAVLRSYMPHTVRARAIVLLAALMAVLIIAIALVGALATSLDTNGVAAAGTSPFRWA